MINKKTYRYKTGFTLVELIVVILVIGVIATVAMVSYQGLQGKARDTSVLSDLDAMDGLQTNYGLKNKTSGLAYYSGTGSSSQLGFTPSPGNVIDVVVNGDDYCIRGYNPNSNKKSIWDAYTKESSPGVCNLLPPSVAAGGFAVVAIGAQIWTAQNINKGTMVSSPTAMDGSNGIEEKYCYDNIASNCTTYGGLYTWDEAMQGSTTAGAQGICYSGYHVPTDADWQTLESYLGMSAGELGSDNAWRSSGGVGTKLKVGGSSGFNSKQGGFYGGGFQYLGLTDSTGVGGYWTSTRVTWFMSQVPVNRIVEGPAPSVWVGRFLGDMMGYGDHMSVRCVKNP